MALRDAGRQALRRLALGEAGQRTAAAAQVLVKDAATHDAWPRSYYSPMFEADEIPDEVWERRSEMPGIELDLDAQAALLRELAPLAAELADAVAGTPYTFSNSYYEHGDAEAAYALVRHLRPRRVVELGSGLSSHVLGAACRRNREDGSPVSYEAYDPVPREVTSTVPVDGLDRLHQSTAQDVPQRVFDELEDGDVLFVDTTHVVKTGGDVNRIVLDVLPGLAPGVVVHLHDIWLPYEYHRALTEHLGMCWSEQYLLQAFLCGNPAYEIVLALQALHRDRHEDLRAFCPGWDGSTWPSAFWMRRTAAPL